MQCKKLNTDNYQFYLLARVQNFKSSRQDYLQSCSFLGCICRSRRWRPWWLHLLWWWLCWCHFSFPHLLGLWTSLRQSRFIFHNFFRFFIFFLFICWGLILLVSRWSMSPPGAGLLWLLISGITIEITTYLLSRELEVDLSKSDIDDCVGCVEERSSKDDGCIIFFFTHI